MNITDNTEKQLIEAFRKGEVKFNYKKSCVIREGLVFMDAEGGYRVFVQVSCHVFKTFVCKKTEDDWIISGFNRASDYEFPKETVVTEGEALAGSYYLVLKILN